MPPLGALLPDTITPYLLLMLGGFLVGAIGHLYKSKLAVGIGIAMIFAATLLLPLAVIATEEEPPSNPEVLAPGTR